MTQPQKIGELNGPWSVLLRLALATYIPLMMWGAWVTVAVVEIQATRYTAQDATRQRVRFEDHLLRHKREDHPPKWVVDLLERHSKELDR